jgi:hypothetical protein
MGYSVLGEHCPITGNLVKVSTIAGSVTTVPTSTTVYANNSSKIVADAIACALQTSITTRRTIKARKTVKK